jgi:hypothetical protein
MLRGRGQTAPRPDFDDDYAERMKVNAAVFVFVILLITVGIWLVDSLTQETHHCAPESSFACINAQAITRN